MKVLLIVIAVIIIAILILLVVLLIRAGRRGYQKYSGLERQRNSAKLSRVAGADRLKSAEQKLVAAQRELAGRGAYDQAQEVERQRIRLSTQADRLRHATYGYSPVGSANPVHETELADLQQWDADTIADAQALVEIADDICRTATDGQRPDLGPLKSSLDLLQDSLDRRQAAS
jgi:FtsZ-interacting cell division protein ZipA